MVSKHTKHAMTDLISRFILTTAAACLLWGCGANEDPKGDGAGDTPPSPSSQSPIVPVNQSRPLSFNEDIRPILSDKCFFCHGPDRKTREADLRLDLEEPAHADLGGYAAIVPGQRGKSELWLRIIDTDDPMPPKKSHKTLEPAEIELIGRWIDEGGKYETHWAYTALQRPELPVVKDQAWADNAVDRFIRARLEARGIDPSPEATKRELLRRVTFDLTGLPPTPEQADAFLKDDSPNAYEKYVDSLLESPAFGEHLAVWWLDLVRYGDSKGYHGDQPRSAWAYRDWVVQAFNDNMPFDRFTRLQLGGDLMQDEPTREMLIASAYNRLALQTEEGGAQPKEYEAIYNADRVNNFGEVWLGSSIGCAQCHDHKFDPILMEDFYALAAFFADINQPIVSHRSGYGEFSPPYMFVPQDEEQEQLVAEHDKAYRAFVKEHPGAMLVEEHLMSTNPKPPLPGPDGTMPDYGEALKKLLEERAALAKKVPTLIETRALETPRTVRLLHRGNWQDESGPIVEPATPSFLPGPPVSDQTQRLNRLDLANWLFEQDNPMPARVVVNRLWGMYFGSPLSINPIDLGSQGRPPTHPELLDWLAVEFVESGWELKHMIRTMVTSKTYKQSANARQDLAEIDPNNTRLFARQTAKRLSAEAVRDVALRVSGLLDDRIGGPAVFPYQPEGHWDPLNFPRRKYPTSTGSDLYRRSLYTWVQRTFPHPLMVSFDATSREVCTGQRINSTTPLQSLALLNAPIFVESARVLAEHVIAHDKADDNRLNYLYTLALARTPRDSERATLMALLEKHREHFKASPEEAQKLASAGEAPVAEGLDPAEVAAWTSVCRVVLNLHETITRN